MAPSNAQQCDDARCSDIFRSLMRSFTPPRFRFAFALGASLSAGPFSALMTAQSRAAGFDCGVRIFDGSRNPKADTARGAATRAAGRLTATGSISQRRQRCRCCSAGLMLADLIGERLATVIPIASAPPPSIAPHTSRNRTFSSSQPASRLQIEPKGPRRNTTSRE
jgi:hypothetical protein